MTFEISWQQPRRVIYGRFFDNVTLEELASVQGEMVRHMDEGDGIVHTIIDLGGVRDFPKSVNQVRRAVEAETNSKSGRVMIVLGSNPLVKFIAHVISQVLFKETQFTFCNSVDEAISNLHRLDSTLTPENVNLTQ